MSKLCGYCRLNTHDRRNCELLQSQIDRIKKFVPQQRKYVAEIASQHGIGVGAIVEAYNYRKGADEPCIIQSMVPTVQRLDVIDYRDIKYSKQVRSRLYAYNVETIQPDSHLIQYYLKSRFYVECRPLADMSSTITACFDVLRLQGKTNNDGYADRHSYDHFATVLSPSEDTDVEEINLLEKVTLSRRLVNGPRDNHVPGIRTW